MADVIKDKSTYWFIAFCTLHLIVWTVLPSLIYGNPPTDSLEGVVWGNLWQWGYPKHPFLAPWITAFFTYLFHSVGWPIYLASQIAVVICFWAVWTLAKKIVTPWQALISVVLLEGVNFYNTEAVIFNPNVLMLPLWALTTLMFYNAVRNTKNNLIYWVLAGLFAGLAIDTKYETFLLLLVLFLLLLVTKEGRNCFKRPGVYVGAMTTILVFLPNFLWLLQHHFSPVDYVVFEIGDYKHTARYAFIYEPLQFTVNQFLTLLPIFILSLPFYSNRLGSTTTDAFDKRFLLFVALGPFLLTLLFSIVMQATLISRWAFPFFSFFGLLWITYLQPVITKKNFTQFTVLIGLLFFLLIMGEIVAFIYLPYLTGRSPHSATFPGDKIAMSVTKQWHAKYNCPLSYIAGDHHVSVNISAFSSDKPKPFFDWDLKQSPWIDENDFKRKGAVFVLWVDNYENVGEIQKYAQQHYPNLIDQSEQKYSRLTGANVPPIVLWLAILPPTDPACLKSG